MKKKITQKKKVARQTRSSRGAKVDLKKYFEAKLAAEIGPHGLKEWLDQSKQDIVVLDVRDKESYEEEHIPTAINIPFEEFEERWKELPKDKEVVSYCWSLTCFLAPKAALFLAKKNLRVKELVGGIGEWKNYKFPVQKKGELAEVEVGSAGSS